MAATDVIAVMGACAPERARYARGLADAGKRRFIPAAHLGEASHPAEEAAFVACWSATRFGSVVEFPTEIEPTEVIAAFSELDGAAPLRELVCVVDAAHLLHDLADDSFLARLDETGSVEHIARALLTVHQIEYATTVVLLNWRQLATPDVALVMALICHLGPSARIQLHNGWHSFSASPAPARTPAQDRPSWVRALNNELRPRIAHSRVGFLRHEQVRPLHPERLMGFLDERVDQGEFGSVLRSAGFCRLATRPSAVAQWDHAGSVISLRPLADDDQMKEGEELLSVGQDLVFIGVDLDRKGLVAALDEVVLTDEELLAGPKSWAELPDPFPLWPSAQDRAD